MSKDFPMVAGALYSRITIETGVEASVIVCGHFLDALNAQLAAKRSRMTRKIELMGRDKVTREMLYDFRQLSDDCDCMTGLVTAWRDVRPDSTYYLTTTSEIRDIAEHAYEVVIRQDIIDIPDAARFASYRPEGDR